MRRFSRIFFIVFVVPLLLTLLAAPGCGKGKRVPRGGGDDEGPGAPTDGTANVEKPSGEKKPVVAKGYGTIKGKVMYEGGRPNFAAADKELQSQMSKQENHDFCLVPTDIRQVGQQDWIIGDKGEVANVLVFLKPAGNDFFQLTPKELEKKSWPSHVIIDQPHCAFMPRVAVLFSEYKDAKTGTLTPSGQDFKILNSATISHNTKWEGDPTKNPPANQTLPPAKSPTEPTTIDVHFKPQRSPITIACDVHRWMNGKIWAFDHPYAAVTKGDAKDDAKEWGTYEIRDVPAGVPLHLVGWHEFGRAGGYFLPEGQRGREITLKVGEVREIDLTVTK